MIRSLRVTFFWRTLCPTFPHGNPQSVAFEHGSKLSEKQVGSFTFWSNSTNRFKKDIKGHNTCFNPLDLCNRGRAFDADAGYYSYFVNNGHVDEDASLPSLIE